MARLSTFFASFLLSIILLVVHAQDHGPILNDLPGCAGTCANAAALAVGCTLAAAVCARASCGVEDQSTTNAVLSELCASASTTTKATSSSSSNSSSATSTKSTSSSTASTTPTSKATSTTTQPTTTSSATTTSTPATTLLVTATANSLSLTVGGTTLSVGPSSVIVVLSTSTADAGPTNAAMAIRGEGLGVGVVGAVVGGLLALL
ncbi:hypothetical protein H0H93_004163 [Arthromyces matolae]|nr:hypothetical protein H0H93_004163 [Arthromyces matolae]